MSKLTQKQEKVKNQIEYLLEHGSEFYMKFKLKDNTEVLATSDEGIIYAVYTIFSEDEQTNIATRREEKIDFLLELVDKCSEYTIKEARAIN